MGLSNSGFDYIAQHTIKQQISLLLVKNGK